MVARLTSKGPQQRPSIYRLNTKQLEDVVLLAKLSKVWEDIQKQMIEDNLDPEDLLFKGLASELLVHMVRLKLLSNENRKQGWEQTLAEAQLRLETDPQSVIYQR